MIPTQAWKPPLLRKGKEVAEVLEAVLWGNGGRRSAIGLAVLTIACTAIGSQRSSGATNMSARRRAARRRREDSRTPPGRLADAAGGQSCKFASASKWSTTARSQLR
jgi:hypothetical protein